MFESFQESSLSWALTFLWTVCLLLDLEITVIIYFSSVSEEDLQQGIPGVWMVISDKKKKKHQQTQVAHHKYIASRTKSPMSIHHIGSVTPLHRNSCRCVYMHTYIHTYTLTIRHRLSGRVCEVSVSQLAGCTYTQSIIAFSFSLQSSRHSITVCIVYAFWLWPS